MSTIFHEFTIVGPIQQVFDAISLPEQLVNWWPKACEGKRQINATYRFFFGEEYDWYGQVAHLVLNESFYIKMTESDPDWNPTTFGFDLSKRDGKVNVVFFHKDWPEANSHFRIASFCWGQLLSSLKCYVEDGVIKPFEQRS